MFTQAQIDQITAALVANAAGPASASNDIGSVSSKSVNELIDAIRFMASMKGASASHRGLRMNALRPAGAVFGHGELHAMDQVELGWVNRRFV